jgi:hypothetical protein
MFAVAYRRGIFDIRNTNESDGGSFERNSCNDGYFRKL